MPPRLPSPHRFVAAWWILFWSFSFCVSANLTTSGDEQPCLCKRNNSLTVETWLRRI